MSDDLDLALDSALCSLKEARDEESRQLWKKLVKQESDAKTIRNLRHRLKLAYEVIDLLARRAGSANDCRSESR